jgi:TonB family protein
MTAALALALLASAPAIGDEPEPDAVTSIDRDLIRRVVRKHTAQVRACYEAGLARHPDLRGRVVVRFTIAESGKVESSEVESSDLGDAMVGECIAHAVLGWRFVGGARIVVSYPFGLGLGSAK